ncbi:MAG: geranylgeranyl reductase family protein [Methermicoccaceae archaeon]
MSEHWQIVVVGAGPAGLTAARVAASMGASVLVVEEHSEVGIPVQCAGFLPQPHELVELLPFSQLDEEIAIVKGARLNSISLQRLVAPDGTSKQFDVDGWVLDRARMDGLLAQSATRAGAAISLSTQLKSLVLGEGACTLTLSRKKEHESVRADVVIGADGPLSKVASQSGLVQHMGKKDTSFCLYEVMDGVDVEPDTIEMYFGSGFAPGGYGWVIPYSSSSANVGTGTRLAYGANVQRCFEHFVNNSRASPRLEMGRAVVRGGGLVPCGLPPSSTCRDNVLIVGDAASHVVSTSGGGIPLALAAGRLAGMCAARTVLDGHELCEYERLWRREFMGCIEGAYAIRRASDMLVGHDTLISTAMRLLSPPQLKRMQQGRVSGALMRLMCALTGAYPPKC